MAAAEKIIAAFEDHAGIYGYNADYGVGSSLLEIYTENKKKGAKTIAKKIVEDLIASGIIQLSDPQIEESLDFWIKRISVIKG